MYGRLGELAFKEMLPGREACQEDFLSAFWVRYLLVLGGAVPVPEVEVFGQPGPAAFFPSLVVGATFLSPGGPPLGRWGQVLPFASPSLISSSRSVSLKALCPETIRLMRDTDSTNCRAISDKLICDA